jgi:hypothetical protein
MATAPSLRERHARWRRRRAIRPAQDRDLLASPDRFQRLSDDGAGRYNCGDAGKPIVWVGRAVPAEAEQQAVAR